MSSGAVVFIEEGCVHRCSKQEMFFLVKRCAAVEGMLIAWRRDEFGRNIVLSFLYCTRKQHTVKAVVKVSRNIESY